MRKPLSIFGWKAILRNYGWTNLWLDSILPLIVSLGLCTLMHVKDADILLQLKHLVGVGISIVPAMVALILTAYTIMLTFIIGDKFASIKKTEEGRQLIQDLTYIIHSGFISGYQNRYGDNLKPPTNVYHRMTA